MPLVRRDMKELREASEELLSGSWLQISQEARRKLISDFCVGYMLPPLSQFAPTTYRARINDAGRLFEHRDELWAPPAKYILKAGRLNKPGERVLYVSGQPGAAIFETKATLGTQISVLACRSREKDEGKFQL